MKKYKVVALVGTLALLANLLVPGLAFGADITGTLGITCNTTPAGFTLTPGSFTFYGDGSSTPIISQVTAQWAYGNPNGFPLSTTDLTGDYFEITDVRDPSALNCNNGVNVTVTPGNFADATTLIQIPLASTYVVSSNGSASLPICPATSDTERGKICIDVSSFCGRGNGVANSTCASGDGVASTANLDYIDASDENFFATPGTYSVNLSGGAKTIVNFVDCGAGPCSAGARELYGSAGVALAYAVNVPGGQAAGTYVLPLTYTVTSLP